MRKTAVKEIMRRDPVFVSPMATLSEAAQQMEIIGCGVLPVGTERQVEGIITDRDIVLRAVAKGKDTNMEKVQDYMSTNLYHCKEDDTLENAADLMRDYHVSRLLVKDNEDNVTGLITFGCILRKERDAQNISNVIEHAVGRKAA